MNNRHELKNAIGSQIVNIGLLAILLNFSFAKPAYAYLDPGTGSYVFQLVIAGLIGSSFFVRSFIKKIRNKFKNQKQKDTGDEK